MSADPFLLAVLAGMFGLLLVPGVAVLAGLRRYREDLRARRSPLAYRAMVAALAGAGCCFLLVPFAVVAGGWTTLATLGRTASPEGVPLGAETIAALGNTVGLLFAVGAGLVVVALSVAALDGLYGRLGADA